MSSALCTGWPLIRINFVAYGARLIKALGTESSSGLNMNDPHRLHHDYLTTWRIAGRRFVEIKIEKRYLTYCYMVVTLRLGNLREATRAAHMLLCCIFRVKHTAAHSNPITSAYTHCVVEIGRRWITRLVQYVSNKTAIQRCRGFPNIALD